MSSIYTLGPLQGVEFRQVHVGISESYIEMYDAAAALWLQVKEAIDFCKGSGLMDDVKRASLLPTYVFAAIRD